MKLTRSETEVLKLLLQNKVSHSEWQELLSSYEIINYNFTGVGYFLAILCSRIQFEKEIIYKPVVMGKVNGLEVGFVLFADGNSLTIECHEWSGESLPKNMRELEVQITVEEKVC